MSATVPCATVTPALKCRCRNGLTFFLDASGNYWQSSLPLHA